MKQVKAGYSFLQIPKGLSIGAGLNFSIVAEALKYKIEYWLYHSSDYQRNKFITENREFFFITQFDMVIDSGLSAHSFLKEIERMKIKTEIENRYIRNKLKQEMKLLEEKKVSVRNDTSKGKINTKIQYLGWELEHFKELQIIDVEEEKYKPLKVYFHMDKYSKLIDSMDYLYIQKYREMRKEKLEERENFQSKYIKPLENEYIRNEKIRKSPFCDNEEEVLNRQKELKLKIDNYQKEYLKLEEESKYIIDFSRTINRPTPEKVRAGLDGLFDYISSEEIDYILEYLE